MAELGLELILDHISFVLLHESLVRVSSSTVPVVIVVAKLFQKSDPFALHFADERSVLGVSLSAQLPEDVELFELVHAGGAHLLGQLVDFVDLDEGQWVVRKRGERCERIFTSTPRVDMIFMENADESDDSWKICVISADGDMHRRQRFDGTTMIREKLCRSRIL